jgi:hypothetical protein
MKGINKYNLNTTSNHKKLRHRKSIRLKGDDYSQAELYFSKICCQGRIYRFEKIQKWGNDIEWIRNCRTKRMDKIIRMASQF